MTNICRHVPKTDRSFKNIVYFVKIKIRLNKKDKNVCISIKIVKASNSPVIDIKIFLKQRLLPSLLPRVTNNLSM